MQLTKPASNSLLTLIFLLFSAGLFAQVRQTAVPQWICSQTVNPDDTIASAEIVNGSYFMLIDRQLNELTKQVYYHYAYKVVNAQGVQKNSEISIDYIPAYQKFSLHTIKVYRNGKILTSGVTSQIKEIQQERDLDRYIYDETRTVYIVLKDIRPNDVIEYDFTIDGFNPIFRNNLYHRFSPNLNYTLLHFYYRIVKSSQEVKYKYYNSAPLPYVKRNNNQEEWVWDCRNNKPVEEEDYTPAWYTNYPMVEISSFKSWKDVEKWGLDVFSNNETLSEGLKQEITSIKARYPDTESRVIAAVRFVQKHIRYLGLEIGESSHKPNSPNNVFMQRHGDCKDKSLLLCKMLNEMEVEAYPVLVNTWLGNEITERIPSAHIFNHVIVKAIVNNQEYWFDPTISTQEGNLNYSEIPDYRNGLVLDGLRYGLDNITRITNTKTLIVEKLHVEDYDGNATLKVITSYHGADADDMRYTYTSRTLKDIQKDYLTYYRNTYDSIRVEENLTYEDDTIRNIFTTTEFYRIKELWAKGTENQKLNVSSSSIIEKIDPYINLEVQRKTPLYIDIPNIHHSITIEFPDNWDLLPDNDFISNQYFYFSSKSSYNKNICNLDYHISGYQNSIPSKDVALILGELKKAREQCGTTFTYNPTLATTTAFSTELFLIFILSMIILSYVLLRIYKKREPLQERSMASPAIGGWLILPVLGLFLTPVLNLISIFTSNLFDSVTYNYYTSVTSEGYNSLWAPFWFTNLLAHAAYLVFPVMVLFMIFRYDRRAPVYMIGFYTGNIVLNVITYLLIINLGVSDQPLMSEGIKDLVRSLMAGAIWIPYFIYSARVKSTFVC